MALPTVTKTWQHSVSNVIAGQATQLLQNQMLLYAIKNAMCTFGTLPWTVTGSSDGATAAMDAADRWSAASKLIWSGSVGRSWIVLHQGGLGTGFQLLIHLGNATSYNGDVYFSPNAGFTGGSTTTRPTATDEVAVVTNGEFLPNIVQGVQQVWHVMQSTDGQCTRVIINTGSKTPGLWLLDKATNTVTGWTYPVAVSVNGGVAGTDISIYANYRTVNTSCAGFFGSKMALYLTAEHAGNTASGSPGELILVANDISSEWPMSPIGLMSTDTSKHGRHGSLADIWWGCTALQNGTTYPASTARTYAQFGHMIFPWNGTIPVVA